MEAVAYLDTHVVVWLFYGRTEQLSLKVKETIETKTLLISPMVVLELEYLHEAGKVEHTGEPIVEDLASSIGLSICTIPFQSIVKESLSIHWTRDPFDRIITAQALAGKSPLLTKDKVILSHCKHALWD